MSRHRKKKKSKAKEFVEKVETSEARTSEASAGRQETRTKAELAFQKVQDRRVSFVIVVVCCVTCLLL